MSSFGTNSKNNRPGAPDAFATAALKPMNFNFPDSQLSVENGQVNFKAKNNKMRRAGRKLTDSKLLETLGNIPTQMDPQAMFNNPFYDTAHGMALREIDSQRAKANKELDDSLNARNQMGGSYDAYRRSLMDSDFNKMYMDAGDRARLLSADVYNQGVRNQLGVLQGLRNDRTQENAMRYLPFQLATGYQSAVSPLQTALGNYYAQTYASQPQQSSWLDKAFGYAQQGSQIASNLAGMFRPVPAP